MNHNDDRTWLNAIDAAYTPKGQPPSVPNPTELGPRPLWHRLSSSLVIVISALVITLAVGLGL